GLCFFNNMAIAAQKIRPMAERILIIDLDLHFGVPREREIDRNAHLGYASIPHRSSRKCALRARARGGRVDILIRFITRYPGGARWPSC
ncbi:MAG: hypothetical protein ACXWG8_09795, partial [Usitatibacter sp.]